MRDRFIGFVEGAQISNRLIKRGTVLKIPAHAVDELRSKIGSAICDLTPKECGFERMTPELHTALRGYPCSKCNGSAFTFCRLCNSSGVQLVI